MNSTTPRKKNRLGKACMALGITAILVTGGTLGYQLYGSDKPAQEHIQAVLADISPDTGPESATPATLSIEANKKPAPKTTKTGLKIGTPSPSEVKAGEAFGTVSNPLFDLQPLVMSDKTSTANSQAILNSGVVVYQSRDVDPGEVGNIVITGHRISHGAVFSNAVNLKLDDVIQMKTADDVFEYRVIKEVFTVAPDAANLLIDPLSDGSNSKRKLMTLITCGDFWDDDREIVVLELVE